MPGATRIPSAVQADEMWRALLRAAAGGPVRGTAETAFAHAVNADFGDAGGAAPHWARFALLAADGRPGPGALITRHADLSGVEAGDSVVIDADGIRIERGGGIDRLGDRVGGADRMLVSATELCDVEFFTSAVESVGRAAGCPEARADRPEALAATLAAVARPGSFVPSEEEPSFARAVRASLAAARERFRAALSAAVERGPEPVGPALGEAARRLIGLGVGLTPSGDDYLVGALCMLSLHPGSVALAARAGLAHEVREALLGAARGGIAGGAPVLTTAVSRHFLLVATEGAFQRDLAAAGRAALACASRESADTGRSAGRFGDSDTVSCAFAAAAAVGATSGTDALLGLVDAYAVLVAACGRERATGSGPAADSGAAPGSGPGSGACHASGCVLIPTPRSDPHDPGPHAGPRPTKVEPE